MATPGKTQLTWFRPQEETTMLQPETVKTILIIVLVVVLVVWLRHIIDLSLSMRKKKTVTNTDAQEMMDAFNKQYPELLNWRNTVLHYRTWEAPVSYEKLEEMHQELLRKSIGQIDVDVYHPRFDILGTETGHVTSDNARFFQQIRDSKFVDIDYAEAERKFLASLGNQPDDDEPKWKDVYEGDE
jgi:DNA-directed RNA polymerase subunit F